MDWFFHDVLPGLITGLPYVLIGALGLWLNWKKTIEHVRQENARQTERIVGSVLDQLDADRQADTVIERILERKDALTPQDRGMLLRLLSRMRKQGNREST